jgi:hypothetical protein
MQVLDADSECEGKDFEFLAWDFEFCWMQVSDTGKPDFEFQGEDFRVPGKRFRVLLDASFGRGFRCEGKDFEFPAWDFEFCWMQVLDEENRISSSKEKNFEFPA